MQSNKIYIILGGIAGLLGVALGAFGAHGLKDVLSPEMLEVYKTGIMYHLIHAVTVVAVSINASAKYNTPSLFFLIGIVLFSFSLYLYAVTGITVFAMVTPIGGVSFITGWALLVYKTLRKE